MAISESLQADLTSIIPIEQVFQKHVVDGSSYFFKERLQKIDWEYELRHELAKSLDVSINDVIIVGSAKLGFSLKTEEFNQFDFKFSNTKNPRDLSDIDIAVVNRKLYDKTIEQVFHLSRHFEKDWIEKNWKMNAFYKIPDNLHKRYALYLAKGWLRPDLLPSSFYDVAPWRPVCDDWRVKLRRKIALGFYSDWLYLKHYQMDNLDRLRNQLNSLEA
ncbi:MAG: hypothetical protein Q8J80_06450 [Gallionella sp.]|nr:hypothetical protein [Gallionella sp.]